MAERAHPDDPAFQGTVYEERLRDRYARCQPYVQGRDVLDVPCGAGWGSSLLSGYASLTGLDIDADAIAFATQRYPGIRFVTGPMEALPFEDASFDVVLCLEGLEHVFASDARAFLRQARRVLRPGGRLILTAPLLNAGKHSGNPYHLYEFREPELRAMLEPLFELELFETFEGGDGPTVRSIGVARDAAGEPAAPAPAAEVFARTGAWLDGLRLDSAFRFATAHPANLMSTCWGVLSLEGLGHIDTMSAGERAEMAATIRATQSAESGLFRDPLLDQFPIESDSHDESYVLHQMTYFALQALDALGERAEHPLSFMAEFDTPAAIVKWLDGLDWSNAWLQSNRLMFVLAFLIYQAEVAGDREAPARLHAALDWLDAAQDPATGLWGMKDGASLLNGMAAAYHFLPFFEYVHRPIRSINALIDSTLALQQADGLFGAGIGGGACEDLDAIDVLAVAARHSSHRADDVRRALVRAFWAIWSAQNDDGGFGYARSTQTYRFSSWAPLEISMATSDTWATWFRLMALATIRCVCPGDLPDLGAWNFRRWPALGYHRHGDALSQHDRAVLGGWLRPLPAASQGAPRISVVIPCYNLGRYLHEAIESALLQTIQPIEIIVVDDGSTDELTRAVVDAIEHPIVRVVRQANAGLPAARNRAIREARAPFICCLDADDRIRPAYFERALELLEHDAQIGFVTSHYQEFDNRHGLVEYASCGLPEMLVTNRATVSSVFRREAWERAGGYAEALSGMHDWDLWIGMLGAGYRGAMIPEVLFDYRVRAGSMYSTSSKPENYARLVGLIAARHPALYAEWQSAVVQHYALEFARLVKYSDGQAQLVRELRLQSHHAAAEHLTYLEQQVAGMRAEAGAWQQIAQARAEWIAQVEFARDYHAQQAKNWEQVAHELQEQLSHQAVLIEQHQVDLGQQQTEIGQLRAEIEILRNENWAARIKRKLRATQTMRRSSRSPADPPSRKD